MVYKHNKIIENQEETHGDKIIEFIEDGYSNYSIYYFDDAYSGKITDKSIIEGLEWLIQNDIKKVI